MGANSLGITGPLRTVSNASGTDIPAYVRVKISGVKASGVIPVAIASAADGALGVFITQQVIPANGGMGVAATHNKGGNQIVTMSGAATAGTAIDYDDNGQYKTTVGGPVGVSEDTVAGTSLVLATLY